MEDKRYDPFPELVEYFYSAVEKNFLFLSIDLGFQEGERIIDVGKGNSTYDKATFPQNIWIFSASKKYELKGESFEISYGDRESFIQIIYEKGKTKYALWQIYEAMGIERTVISGSQFVLNTAFMEKILSDIALGLKKNISNILPISKNTEKIIQANVERIQLEWKLKEESREIETAIEQAANAFREKNYFKVVAILSKYEGKLRPAQQMKLAYCRKHLH
ncbi:hypothetical protein [Leptospira dzoumogneensis]|uniref:Uncharacterized protein n=1 Tax=Leptospira dzoumogneensis TaxID=2484904 RepID=A0A4Z1AJH8_9LEPT|nr:hypothetical protein [Leptospira dzoumogneensis]TGM98985.1 hypothetical protein EHR06_10980 [Leptospira dzoumogneensis]